MVVETQEPQKGLTFEKVWTMFQETGWQFKAMAQEADKRQQEIARQMQETDRRMQETDRRMQETDRRIQETDRLIKENAAQMKATDKKFGELYHRFGDVVEHLIAPNLIEKFNAMNFDFRTAGPNRKFYDNNHQEIAEVDILLENTNTVMAVEVKSKLLASHVQDHIERMDILRAYADEHNDRRVWLGAVGGALLATDARKAALKAGFYLIEQSGDTVMISVPSGFKPKEWTFRMIPQKG
jgi:hypothetical protein